MKKNHFLLLAALCLISSCSQSVISSKSDCYINDNWQLASSAKVSNGYAPQSDTAAWINIQIPSTVLNGLRQSGLYSDIYFSDNLEKIDIEQFQDSWWYRKEFSIDDFSELENYVLVFEGLNYRANIWLNGKLIGDKKDIEGPYATHKFDITPYADAHNVLAVEVFPPQKSDLTIGFVDWNPNTPDNNMGLWRGVRLQRAKGVILENVVITSDIQLNAQPMTADLKLDLELKNYRSEAVSGTMNVKIDNQHEIKIPYELDANETKRIIADAHTYSALHFENPRLWWPVHMGKPELYDAQISVYANGELSFVKDERFGIRKLEDYTFTFGEKEVVRGYKINGEKVLIRGGGWVDDMTLADTDAKVRAQVEYVKHMNLNTIRLEGFWGNSKELYEACDEHGILLMIGLSCQWEWEGYCGRPEHEYMMVDTPHDIQMVSKAYQDQVKWGMNHPSIFLWVYGSDKLPTPELETALNHMIRAYDKDRCILASCKSRWQETGDYQVSKISGNPGSKMLGPYEYVPPVYWYEDATLGGAYGFNTETGPGAQIPPIESIKKMLAPDDWDKINEAAWQYHCGRNEFKNLDKWLNIFGKRYWDETTAEGLAFNAQISNYESIRAMFEAFEIKRMHQSTGIVQWMLNSAWPEMYWQLYDWYLNPNGAFYGTKTALQALNLIYNYADKNIYWSNNTPNDQTLFAEIKLYDIHSNETATIRQEVEMNRFSVGKLTQLTQLPSSDVYFLSLKLYDKANSEVSNNFYWLSKTEDKLDYTKSTWFYSPQSEYASFAQLKQMQAVNLHAETTFVQANDEVEVRVKLKNPSDKIAFFTELRLVDKTTQQTILPVFWSDNYLTLLPNEEKTLTAKLTGKSDKMVLIMKSFNEK